MADPGAYVEGAAVYGRWLGRLPPLLASSVLEVCLMESAVEERTGVDEALVWRLYRTDATSPDTVLAAARALPEDALLLADYIDEAMQQALQEAGFNCHYSAFDVAYLIAGPTQRDRARSYRQHTYRIIGKPA